MTYFFICSICMYQREFHIQDYDIYEYIAKQILTREILTKHAISCAETMF